MSKFFVSFALLSAFISTSVMAVEQPQVQRSGTKEEQAACARDVTRFCREVIDQGDFTILACLKQNRKDFPDRPPEMKKLGSLSEACNQVLISHGQ
jgi:hypothetical protein